MTQEIVRIDNVTKRYSENSKILDGLSFSLLRGEKCGLVGLNGSGKSTTLNILLGQLKPNSGNIFLNSKNIAEFVPDDYNSIGFLLDNFPVLAEFKVTEYFDYLSYIKGRDEEHFKYLIEYFEITKILNSQMSHLSKGQEQLIGLVQALMNNPELIILDEPMVNLDPRFIVKLRNYLKSLDDSKTLIISSHRLNEIELICDRFLFLHEGKDIYPSIHHTSFFKVRFGSMISDPHDLGLKARKIIITDGEARFVFDSLNNKDEMTSKILTCFSHISFFSWDQSIEDSLLEYSEAQR